MNTVDCRSLINYMDLLNSTSLPFELQNAVASYSFVAGQRLFRQGDRAHNFYLVTSGRVRLVRYTIEGKMVVLQVVRRGESLSADALNSKIYSYTAIAEDLRARLVEKIQSLEVSLELLKIRSAHLRLLQYLQYNAAASNNETVFNLDQTWKEIATELNLAPRTVSQALTRLESQGLITRQAESITLQIL